MSNENGELLRGSLGPFLTDPQDVYVALISTAYESGRESAHTGYDRSSNPYFGHGYYRSLARAWESGWSLGDEEAQEREAVLTYDMETREGWDV